MPLTHVTAPEPATEPLFHVGLSTKKLLPPTSTMPPYPTWSMVLDPVSVLISWLVAPLYSDTAPTASTVREAAASTTT